MTRNTILHLSKSLKQLYVPLFMLLVMVFCFAAIVYEIEFDPAVQDCVQLWKAQGVAGWFIKTYGDGVGWDCSACEMRGNRSRRPALE